MLAYNDEVRLMTLSIADGLAGETVNRVMKDHAGRIWIATNNGVNIYMAGVLPPSAWLNRNNSP